MPEKISASGLLEKLGLKKKKPAEALAAVPMPAESLRVPPVVPLARESSAVSVTPAPEAEQKVAPGPTVTEVPSAQEPAPVSASEPAPESASVVSADDRLPEWLSASSAVEPTPTPTPTLTPESVGASAATMDWKDWLEGGKAAPVPASEAAVLPPGERILLQVSPNGKVTVSRDVSEISGKPNDVAIDKFDSLDEAIVRIGSSVLQGEIELQARPADDTLRKSVEMFKEVNGRLIAEKKRASSMALSESAPAPMPKPEAPPVIEASAVEAPALETPVAPPAVEAEKSPEKLAIEQFEEALLAADNALGWLRVGEILDNNQLRAAKAAAATANGSIRNLPERYLKVLLASRRLGENRDYNRLDFQKDMMAAIRVFSQANKG